MDKFFSWSLFCSPAEIYWDEHRFLKKKIKFDLVCLTKLCFGRCFLCGPLPNLISPWLPTLMWFFLGHGIVEWKHRVIHFSSEISAAKFWESFVWRHAQWNKNHILLMGNFFYLVAPRDVCRDWQCLNTYLLLQVLPWKILILCQLWLSMAHLSYMRLCGRLSLFPPCLLQVFSKTVGSDHLFLYSHW